MPFCSKGCRTSSGKRMWHDKRHPCPMEAAGKLKAARAEEAAKPAGGPPDPHPLPEPTVAEGKAPGEAKTPPTTETKPTATEKKTKFQWPFKKASVKTDAENPSKTPDHPPEDTSWVLEQKYVIRLVRTGIKALKELLGFISDALDWEHPEEKYFKIDPAEEDEMGDLLQEPATALMKSMGFKTKERAERFINGLSALAFFGYMFLGIGRWGIKGLKLTKKRKAEGKTASGRTLTPEEREALAKRPARKGLFDRFARRDDRSDRGGAPPVPPARGTPTA